MNYACRAGRLGLILGSGVSDELGLPKWRSLIESLEKVLNYDSGGAPESYRAEQLFQHYKKTRMAELGWANKERTDAAVLSGWRDTVSKCLYAKFVKANGSFDESSYRRKIERHPYLKDLARVAQQSQLVVTHNFDDALETAISVDPSVTSLPNRKYHSFWRPEPFLRRGMVNIYHPNGYTPLSPGLKGSENLILTEASFADHLANTNTEESHFLLRHLADKTCLIVGHSLADGTLKNALRQHANQRPGHVNYYVHWVGGGESSLSEDQRDAIREANFETYNLVTIFASSEQVAEILRLVAMSEDGLEGQLAHYGVPARYVYYFVGAVSSGKSTMIRHLRDISTVEEWPVKMPVAMNRPSIGLAKTDEEKIDESLEEAIWNKNSEIRGVKVGVVAVDRAPIDFLAFPSKKSETMGKVAKRRGGRVLARLAANNWRDFCPGQVIVVRADAEILVDRQLQRGGRTTPEEVSGGKTFRYLEKQRDLLLEVYVSALRIGSVVDTDRCTVAVSVKAAARIIHFCEYKPFDFPGRLKVIQNRG